MEMERETISASESLKSRGFIQATHLGPILFFLIVTSLFLAWSLWLFYFWLPLCQIFFQQEQQASRPQPQRAEGVSFSILCKSCRVWSALPTLWYAKWWPMQIEALAVLTSLTSQNTVSSSPTLGWSACWLHPWKDQAADRTWIRGKLRCICLILAKFCPGYIHF